MMRRLQKVAWFLFRFGIYLLSQLVWPVVLIVLCASNALGRPLFGYIFVVYPGSLDQVRGYMPIWFRHVIATVSPIGIITRGEGMRGLVVTVPWTIEEMEEDSRLPKILNRCRRLCGQIGARAIALAGRMPGAIARSGGELTEPFVAGVQGTIYTIVLSAKQAAEAHDMMLARATVGILGYGHIGRMLASVLKSAGASVIAVDPAFRAERADGSIMLTRDPARLSECDIVVVLTARGEQIEADIVHLRDGVLVIDDTHPQLPPRLVRRIENEKGGVVVKATLGMGGVRFRPRLPKWEADWLPGCCVEALVAAWTGFAEAAKDFARCAEGLKFRALQVENKNDL